MDPRLIAQMAAPSKNTGLLAFAALFLWACGGGGGGGDNGAGAPSTNSTSTSTTTSSTVGSTTTTTQSSGGPGTGTGAYYLYGVQTPGQAGHYNSLTLLAVQDYSQSTALTTNPVEHAAVIPTGDYDTTTKLITNVRPHVGVVAQNGVWNRVDLTGDSTPQLTPFSMQAYGGSFGPLCNRIGIIGGTNLNVSYVVYETGGADGNCDLTADNQRFSQNIMSGAAIPGTDVSSLVTSIGEFVQMTDPGDASQTPQQIVAINRKSIVRYDVLPSPTSAATNSPFNNPAPIATATRSVDLAIQSGQDPEGRGFFVNMDNSIYWYDRATNKLSTNLHAIPTNNSLLAGECDTSYCYFAEQLSNIASSSGRILRIPWAATSAADVAVVVDNIVERVFQVALTDSHLAVAMIGLSAGFPPIPELHLHSMPKSGGNLALIDTSSYISPVMSAGDVLYYTRRPDGVPVTTPPPTGLSAVARTATGTIVNQYDNGTWVGSTTSKLAFTVGIGPILHPDTLVLATDLPADPTLAMGGATLKTYSAANNQLGITLGTVPANIENVAMFGFSNRVVGLAYSIAEVDPATDVIGVDTTKSQSFSRVTNTPDSEVIVF